MTIKVGDKIRITDAYYTDGEYDNGDVLTVRNLAEDGDVYVEGVDIIICEDEFEKYETAEAKPMLQVGNIVKVVGVTRFEDIHEGAHVKIDSGIDVDGEYKIRLLDDSDYDFAKPEALELLAEKSTSYGKVKSVKRPAKVGEKVVITRDIPINGQDYEDGDILTVKEVIGFSEGDIYAEGVPDYIDEIEYEVIVGDGEESAEAITEACADEEEPLEITIPIRIKFNVSIDVSVNVVE